MSAVSLAASHIVCFIWGGGGGGGGSRVKASSLGGNCVTGIGNLQYLHSLLRIPTLPMVGVKEGGKALQTSVLGVKTLHSTAEAPDNTTKASGWELEVAVLGMGAVTWR